MCEGACEWVTRHLTKVRNDNKWQELVGFAVRMWGSLRIGMEYIYTYMTSIGGDHQSDYNVGKWSSIMLNR